MPRASILEYLANFERRSSEIAFCRRRGYRTERWTYGQVARVAYQFARELEARGIGQSDRILLCGENSAPWVAAFFGCLLRGVIVVPMDRIAAPEFVRRVAQEAQIKLALCAPALARKLPGIPALELETLPQIVAARAADRYPSPPAARTDPVEIVFTSGATAEPKGVVITHGNVLANLESFEPEINKYIRYERPFHPIRFLNLLPLSHVFGQFLGIFIPQLIGGTVVFQESLAPGEIARAIRDERVSALVAVPRVLQSLQAKIERDAEARGRSAALQARLQRAGSQSFLRRWWSFRRVHSELGWKFWALISGGATLDQPTEEFWRRLGYAVIQGYGLTETTSLISVNHPFKLGRGSIGKVLPGREMKLSPQGEILVRGESIASGYFQGRALHPVTGEEGWFHTGDLGALDAAGNLYFKGRSKRVLVTPAGLNIYPEDLEAALRRQPEIRDCVVVGLDRGGNEEPCAALIARAQNADLAAAVGRANSTLAQHQQIRCWFAWPDADFPRTPTQKIRLAEVREAASARMAAGAASPPSVATGKPDPLAAMIARITASKAPPANAASDLNLDPDSELNLSSLDRVELLAALEDRYEVDLDDAQLAEARSIAELRQALQQAAPRQSDYRYPRWAQRRPVAWMRGLIYYLLVWPATFLLVAPRVRGREHLRGARGPLLVISNHVTYIDIGFILWALPARLRARLATAMEGELLFAMRRPPASRFFLRRWLDRLDYFLVTALFHVFPLPQRAGIRQSFDFAGALADHGYSVLIFPEGARTTDGALHAFRSGIGLLATRLNLPVLPMKIEGLYRLKIEGRHFAPGKVTVKIGEPRRFGAADDPDRVARELEAAVAAL